MGRGAQRLAKAIEMNTSLQIFDASFNSFGSSTLNKNKKNRLSNNFKQNNLA